MKLLILPHIHIHNANALSSPFTIGFPAMTAWLGFVHALERKLKAIGENQSFISVAVVSHEFDLQTYKGPGDFVHSIVNMANPLNKDGSRSAFIEEARCHLTVSLVIQCDDENEEIEESYFVEKLQSILPTMKIAGGDIFSFEWPTLRSIDTDSKLEINTLLRSLMPGYVLIERRDLMIEAMGQGEDALDAMLSFLTVNHHCEHIENDLLSEPSNDQTKEQTQDKKVKWRSLRKTTGWIVPIATGFQGISELGSALNQRDSNLEHRFAESIVTLGEFVMVHKIKALDDMLWHYYFDLENDLYLCQQNN